MRVYPSVSTQVSLPKWSTYQAPQPRPYPKTLDCTELYNIGTKDGFYEKTIKVSIFVQLGFNEADTNKSSSMLIY